MSIEFFPEKKQLGKPLRATTVLFRKAEPVDPATAIFFVIAALFIAVGIAVAIPHSEPTHSPAAVSLELEAAPSANTPTNVFGLPSEQIGKLEWVDDPDALSRTLRFQSGFIRNGRTIAQVAVPAADGLWQSIDIRPGMTIPNTQLVVERVDPKLVLLRDADGVLHRVFFPPDWPELAKQYNFPSRSPMSAATIRLSESPLWTMPTGSRSIYGIRLLTASTGDELTDEAFRRVLPTLEGFAIEFQSRVAVNPDLVPVVELRQYLIRNRIQLVRLVSN